MTTQTLPKLAPGYTATQFRRPRTGEAPLLVQYRNGHCAQHPVTASQLRWDDSGSGWDIVGVKRA